MIKVTLPDSWNFNEPIASIVDLHSASNKSISDAWMQKRAAAGVFKDMDLKAEKDHSLIHLIALGDADHYGCFIPGTPVINEQLDRTPIEEIVVGDKVFTPNGNLQRVITTYAKPYSGPVLTFTTLGDSTMPVTCTPCHKILTIPAEQVACHHYPSKYNCTPFTCQKLNFCAARGCKVESPSYLPELRAASELREGDYLLIPTQTSKLPNWRMSDAYAYLCGLYAAEGCLPKNTSEIRLCIHQKEAEWFTTQLKSLFREHQDNELKIAVYPDKDDLGCVLVFRDAMLKSMLRLTVGVYSYAKKLSRRLLAASTETKAAFLAGYYDGDGHQAEQDNRWTARTVSHKLALDVQFMLRSMGVNAPLCTASSPKSATHHQAYNVSFSPGSVAGVSLPLSYKHSDIAPLQVKGWSFSWNGFYCIPITSITPSEYSGTVYDLEVENDHKYCVGAGFAVKNSNRNGDSFYKSAQKLNLAEPDWETILLRNGETHTKSASTFADHTESGNLERMHTFTKYGKVYKDHKNRPDKGDPIRGEIKAAAHNDEMGRVELLISLPHGKDWDSDLQKLAEGKDLAFSMSAMTPYDICSICGHKAAKLEDYCAHLSHNMTGISKSGHQTSAINDNFSFFDISHVGRPADRIAWSLVKAANGVISAAELALDPIYASYPDWRLLGGGHSKRAELIHKLAAMEKTIPMRAKALGGGLSLAAVKPNEASASDRMKKVAAMRGESAHNVPTALTELAEAGVLLSYPEFATLMLGVEKAAVAGDGNLSNLFSSLLGDDNVLADTSYGVNLASLSYGLKKSAETLRGELGLGYNECRQRAMTAALRGEQPQMRKVASALPPLASAFAAYQISYLEHVQKCSPCELDHYIEAVCLRNCL